jgi:hypothetical protein
VGYCIGVDRYFKRDDVGIIYQMNVVPGRQRGMVGAALLQAMFDRAAYGCRLFCCWCAQDIEANKFWEAMGFVPLAFRTGGKVRRSDEVTKRRSHEVEDGSAHSVPSSLRHCVTSARTHIFWQKRIRAGDETTAWWFPSQTTGGAIGEARIVLPIPPGTHWSDAKPFILPDAELRLPNEEASPCVPPPIKKPATGNRKSEMPTRGLRFGPSAQDVAKEKVRTKAARRERMKNDPRMVAAARELRDRWLEEVNENPGRLVAAGKYDVRRLAEPARAREGSQVGSQAAVRLLPAA